MSTLFSHTVKVGSGAEADSPSSESRSLFGHAFYTHLGVGGACSLLAGLSALMIIPLFGLFKYGHKLRERSKWAA